MAASGAARAAQPSSGPGSARKTVCERPEASRRSPRLRSQKENIPDVPKDVPDVPDDTPDVPKAVPVSPRRSPLSPRALPRPRRSYSRLEGALLVRPPRAPLPPCPPLSPIGRHADVPEVPDDVPEVSAATALPGIGLGPERRRKRKVPPIDPGELDAWAARVNAQLEEAERFRLVVE